METSDFKLLRKRMWLFETALRKNWRVDDPDTLKALPKATKTKTMLFMKYGSAETGIAIRQVCCEITQYQLKETDNGRLDRTKKGSLRLSAAAERKDKVEARQRNRKMRRKIRRTNYRFCGQRC